MGEFGGEIWPDMGVDAVGDGVDLKADRKARERAEKGHGRECRACGERGGRNKAACELQHAVQKNVERQGGSKCRKGRGQALCDRGEEHHEGTERERRRKRALDAGGEK